MSVMRKNNVRVSGQGNRPILFAHGYGGDQSMWRYVAPAFEADCRVVLFDHAGFGQSAPASYDPHAYDTLEQYAADVLAICTELRLDDVVFVGHSVSAMIGVLAANAAPRQFARLVLIGPSPCYIDEGDYVGGFSRADIDGLLDFLDDNFVGWSQAMAPVIMGNAERPELGAELQASFCRAHRAAARQFARATFLSDTRAALGQVDVPALILQCSDDAIAPASVGRYVHRAMPRSTLVQLRATGHCPNLSAPDETIAAIRAWLG